MGDLPTAPAIDLTVLGTYATGVFDEGALPKSTLTMLKQSACLSSNSNAVTIDILDLSNPTSPTKVGEIDATAYGAGANSVAVKNGIVAVAIENETVTDNGGGRLLRCLWQLPRTG